MGKVALALRRPRRRLRVLRHRNVLTFYAGFVPSELGTAMAAIALAFAVLDNGGSAADLGYVFAAGIVPQVALMLGAGVIADRLGRRRVMLSADLLRTASETLLAVLLFAGHPPVWAFALLAAAVGAGDAFFGPALSGLTVEITPAPELGDANALFGMARSVAAVAGPALAGLLVAVAGPAVVIALDAASYGVSALALSRLQLPPFPARAGRSVLRDLAEGWGEFRSRTWLWLVTAQFTLFNLLAWGPFLLLGPVIAHEDLGGAGAWGLIMAAFGAGAVAGGLAALGRTPRRPLLVSSIATLGYPVPLALLALGLPAPAVAAGAVVAGLGSSWSNIFWSVCLQQQIPAGAQARVSAYSTVGSYSAGPVAYAAAGPVAVLAGARLVLGVGAAWAVVTSMIIIALPLIRAVRWRAGPADAGEGQALLPEQGS